MSLAALRVVAALDALNVLALAIASPRYGAAAAAGYAPAAVATVLVHLDPRRRGLARALCAGGLVPNSVGAAITGGPGGRDRVLAWYVALGGAALGVGYLVALRR